MKEQIRQLLESARTKEALELLVRAMPEAGTLLATFNEASKRNMLGILPYSEFSQKQNEVTYSALQLLDGMGEKGAKPSATSGQVTAPQTPPPPIGKKMFISYSKSDKAYLEELKTQLAPLRRQQLLQIWDDTNLQPGEEWDAAIRRELKTADIIILLVSANLMATDYIWEFEMKEALERSQRGEAAVIPVIIRPCNWEDAPFAKLNALPEKGKPIDTWANKDEAWTQVVKRIRQVL